GDAVAVGVAPVGPDVPAAGADAGHHRTRIVGDRSVVAGQERVVVVGGAGTLAEVDLGGRHARDPEDRGVVEIADHQQVAVGDAGGGTDGDLVGPRRAQ